MSKRELVITKLNGYSGIRLMDNKPLRFKPGINLMVGRNGCGKSNLLRLIQGISSENGEINISNKIESNFFKETCQSIKKRRGNDIIKKFGKISIAKFSINGKPGTISMKLKNVTQDYGLENIIQPGFSYKHNITIEKVGPTADLKFIHNNDSAVKMDLSGSIHSNLISNQPDKHITAILEDSIGGVNTFVKKKLTEFFHSDEFKSEVIKIQISINDKLEKFFGSTNKTIQLHFDSRQFLNLNLLLKDGENYIESIDISTGETVLLNLIISLATEREEKNDILIFDEPELHMHDDMVKVFVQEIKALNEYNPDQKIIIASHSTPLIENLATLGNENFNLIVFKNNREVSNSNDDIDFINALHNNGVAFSPLMLSKKTNLFIENEGIGGDVYKKFFLNFFVSGYKPNVIPIGTSGNVENVDSFASIFEDILKTKQVRSLGIRDGDIWFKVHLKKYLQGKIKLSDLIGLLESQKEYYIPGDAIKQFYFNFWEIENLYLEDELIGCWNKKGINLTLNDYRKLLNKKQNIIFKEYLDTYCKSILRIRTDKNYSVEGKINKIKSQVKSVEKVLADSKELENRINELIQNILSKNLLQWVPGKEIKRLLEQEGYAFDDYGIEYGNLSISRKIEKIIRPQQN